MRGFFLVMTSNDPPKLQTARALWLQSRFEDSLRLFDEVLEEHPDLPLALIDAARANGSHYRILKAEGLLDRCLAVNGENAETLALAGPTYRMIHRGIKALHTLEKAVSLAPADPTSVLELALLLDRAGRGKEALGILGETLGRHPDFMEGRYFHAHLNVRIGDRAAGLGVLETIAADESQHPYLRTRSLHALAEAADRAGEPQQAIAQAARAKSLASKDEVGHLRQIASLLRKQGDQLARVFSQSRLVEWKRDTHPPVTLLTGSPRSGTTLLEKVLDAHPRIRSSDEHALFARFLAPTVLQPPGLAGTGDAGQRLLRASRETMDGLRQRYFTGMEELLGEPLDGRMMLDKNPSLTETIPAWLRMLPHSKILIAIRDPRDVVLSCYLNHFPLNAYSLGFQTLEETALRYSREMKFWLGIRRKLPTSQWREVRYEDCVADLGKTARGVVEWMDLPWDGAVLDYREKLNTRLTQSPTYADVRSPVHTRSVARWRLYRQWLAPLEPILAPFLQEWGYARD